MNAKRQAKLKSNSVVMLSDVRGPVWWDVLLVTDSKEDNATYCMLKEKRNRRGRDDILQCWAWVPNEVLYSKTAD